MADRRSKKDASKSKNQKNPAVAEKVETPETTEGSRRSRRDASKKQNDPAAVEKEVEAPETTEKSARSRRDASKKQKDPVVIEKEAESPQTSDKSGRSTATSSRSSDTTSGVDVTFASPASTSGTSSGAESRVDDPSRHGAIPKGTKSGVEGRRELEPEAAGTSDATPDAEASTSRKAPRVRKRSGSIGAKMRSVGETIVSGIKSLGGAGQSKSVSKSQSCSETVKNPRLLGKSSTVRRDDSVPLLQDEEVERSDSEDDKQVQAGGSEEKMESSPAEETKARGATGRRHTSGVQTRSMTSARQARKAAAAESSNSSSDSSGSNRRLVIKVPPKGTAEELIKGSRESFESMDSLTGDTVTTSVDSSSNELISPDDGISMQEESREEFNFAQARLLGVGRPRLTRQAASEDDDDEVIPPSPSKKPALEKKDMDDEDEGSSAPGVPRPERLI